MDLMLLSDFRVCDMRCEQGQEADIRVTESWELTDAEISSLIDFDMNDPASDLELERGLIFGDIFFDDLLRIDRFVEDAVGTKRPAFEVKDMAGKRVAKCEEWFEPYFPILGALCCSARPQYEYSPKIDLFIFFNRLAWFLHDFSKDPNASMSCAEGSLFGVKTILADGYNDLVLKVREGYKERKINRKISKRNENSRLNYENACRYINGLFDEKRRPLLVIRLDIGYGKDAAEAVTVEQAMADYREFINKRRGKPSVFRHMVGYVAKLEYSSVKRYHFHLMLFFDGSKVRNHSYYGEEVGKYWRDEVTQRRGTYYNCNRHLNRYKRCGIGRVDYRDSVKRRDVLYALSYLTKSEQSVMVKTSKGGRTFFMGQLRKRTQVRSP
jgi:hypothetical protein